MKKLLVLILLGLVINGFSQSKLTKFEQELLSFRYSLYPILDAMDYNQILSYDSSEYNPLMKLIVAFYNIHKEDLFKYKVNVLKRYQDVEFSLDPFKEDTSFYRSSLYLMLNDKNSDESRKLTEIKDSPVYKLMVADPISHGMIYINMYIAQNQRPQSVAKRSVINQIASPKIKTIKNTKTNWTIYFDYYFDVFEFEYSIETADLNLKRKYIRKKE